ncbi:MAG: hypothetical protein K5924_05665 [Chloroflexi bacterium]|nr:hypothetical protein [Chloroflexota bacterium]
MAVVVLLSGESGSLPPYYVLREELTAGAASDPLFGEEAHEYAMTHALLLSAAVAAGDHDTAARSQAWLSADAVAGGWGMAWTWDPFGDGSLTEAGTPFAITTALAIEAMLDADVAGRREASSALQWAETAWTDGFYWYSLAPQDAIDTPNVSAMMAGVTARLLDRHPELFTEQERDLLTDRITASFAHLAAAATDGLRWSYSAAHDVPNDLSHHVYILWGAERARDAGFAVPWTRDEAIASLEAYDGVYPRDAILTEAMAARTGSAWEISGAGMALAFAAEWGGPVAEWRQRTMSALDLAPHVPRFVAHAALGLSLADRY